VDVIIRRLRNGDETLACEVADTFKGSKLAPARARQFLANPANYLIVAESAHAVAGFVLAYRLDRLDREAAQLFVYEVGVTQRHRRAGIGTRLMRHVTHLVAEESLMEAFVHSDRDNDRAMRLYRAAGGQQEGSGSVLFVYAGVGPK
jgi:ribosomal protein S18 acetylase RimI-like enzyme